MLVRHDGRGPHGGERSTGWFESIDVGSDVAPRNVRSRGAPRRSGGAVRHAPGGRAPRVLVHRPCNPGWNVCRRAGPRRRDVFARDIRACLDANDRGAAMTLRRRLWAASLVAALAGVGYGRLRPIPAGPLDLPEPE